MLNYFNTIDEIEAGDIDAVIIPVGSIEQHGSHLPVGTDYLLIKALSEAVASRLNAWLLPPLPFSTCYEHKGRCGNIWMRPITFYQMIQDIVLCLYEQGFKKIAFMLGHGGVFILGPAVRELNALHDDLKVIIVSAEYEETMKLLETEKDIHAGEMETSLMLYLYEEHVKKDLLLQNDFLPACPQSYLNYTTIPKISPTGVWGKPSLATKEKGKALFEQLIACCLAYIEDAFTY
ncbi:MAG: creatininase family protein [Clostridia bacterium]|nr:creatininase family protein [Clostridia bacterium]